MTKSNNQDSGISDTNKNLQFFKQGQEKKKLALTVRKLNYTFRAVKATSYSPI